MWKRTILIDALLLALLIILYSVFKNGFSRTLVLGCLFVCIWEFVTVVLSIPEFKVRPVLVFLFSFWVVNCQLYLDLLVGLIDPEMYVFGDSCLINQGAILSAIAFTSFSVGYKGASDYTPKARSNSSFNHTTNLFLSAFQVLCFIWWVTTLTAADFSGESYASSGAYDSTNSISGYAEIFFTISQVLSLSYLLKRSGSRDIKAFLRSIPLFVLLTSGLYIIIRLFSGDRGGAIYTVVLYLFAYLFNSRKRISLLPFVLVVFIGAIIMTSIGLTRLDKRDLSITEQLTYAYTNRDAIEAPSISPFTRELANSVHCTHIALEQIELQHNPFTLGLFHACYLIKYIPFLGNMVVNSLFHVPRNLQSSSEYVTIAFNGPFYTWGLGTTTIADNYLEFGLIGVIIALILIGVCFKKIDTCILFADVANTPVGMIVFCLVLCYGSLYIPRSAFMMMLRNWFYAMVVYSFVKSFTTSI